MRPPRLPDDATVSPSEARPVDPTVLKPGTPEAEGTLSQESAPLRRQVRCPHCHNPIHVSDRNPDEVHCPACGSTFRIADPRLADTTSPMRRLGKLQLLERVGLGAFGAVWKARDTELDRVVALKIPHAGLLASAEGAERFYREARAAARLRHPGIVPVHEVATLEGSPAIVSDFIEGVTLRDLLQVRRLSFREAAEVVRQLAEALAYAHGMGLVHRDIKPANIMVEHPPARGGPDAGGVGRPLIMDFGLALREEAEVRLTMDEQVVGTPAYMSPEQAAGRGHEVDPRGDVYSLGVVLYELLAGELPFRGTRQVILHQVLREEPRPPRKLNHKVPRDLETICLKCLHKEPWRRYATAQALADDLGRWLAGQPIQARPAGRVEHAWRWCRRNPALAVSGSVAVVALLTATALSLLVAVQATRHAEELGRANAAAEASRLQAQRRLAESALDRGLGLCEDSNVGLGCLWLARCLEETQGTAQELADLQHVARSNLAAWGPQQPPLRAPILQHRGPIRAAAFTPDGRLIVTASQDKTARVWDAATGRPLGPGFRHQQGILALAVSPDGKAVLTGGEDWKAELWELATGRRLIPALTHAAPVTAVAISPDGKTLLTGSEDHTAQLWDAATGKRVGPGVTHKDTVKAVAFALGGRAALTASADGTVQVLDPASGKRLVPPLEHGAPILTVALSRDGKLLVTAGDDRVARLWDVATGKPVGRPLRHEGDLAAVALSPDGRMVLTGSHDNTARLWDVATGTLRIPPVGHDDSVVAVAYSPDGKVILTGSVAGSAHLWSPADGTAVGPLVWHQAAVRVVAFSPDGTAYLTAGADGTARLWARPRPCRRARSCPTTAPC